MAGFDNLDDVSTKFGGSICYHGKTPVLVKGYQYHPEDMKRFQLSIAPYNGRSKIIDLEDPELNYNNYNIGYANLGQVAPWWYRKPVKQYHQGLRKNQMGFKISDVGAAIGLEDTFGFSRQFVSMLENSYPSVESCRQVLKDKMAKVHAFHRDFAISHDAIHNDYILEYRGKSIGSSLNPQLTAFKLIGEAQHLHEALKEALS